MKNKRLIASGFCLMMLCALLVGSVGAAAGGMGGPAAPAAFGFYTISIDSPSNGTYTNDNVTNVQWTVTNPVVGEIYWNESRIFADGSWSDWYNQTTNSSQSYGPLADGTYFVNVRTVQQEDAGPVERNLANVTFTVDTVKPTVVVITPVDGSETNMTNFTIGWDAAGTGSPLDSFNLDVNDGFTHFPMTVDGDVFSIPVGNVTGGIPLADGDWNINVTAFDEAGNSNYSQVTVTVTPLVDITFPMDNSYTNQVNFTATWVGSLTASALDHYDVRLSNDSWSSGWVNVSTNTSIVITNLTDDFANLTDGNWTLEVNITDFAGTTYTDDAAFTVATVPPEVDILYPTEDLITNNNNFTVEWNVILAPDVAAPIDHLNVTIVNTDTDEMWYVIVSNDTTSLALSDIVGANLSDGNYTVSVTAYDAAGNVASDTESFMVDTVAPEVEILAPVDGAYLNVTYFNANWTVSDTMSGVASVWARLIVEGVPNDWVEVTGITSGMNITSFNNGVELADGNYTFEVAAIDQAGNNYSEAADFVIDTVPPTVEITMPVDGQWLNVLSFTAEWNANGTGSPLVSFNVTIENDDTADSWFMVLPGDVFNVTTFDVIGDNLTNGNYSIYVMAEDAAGNTFTAEAHFGIDMVNPTIEIEYPADGAAFNVPDVLFVWEGFDSLSGIAEYQYQVDGGNITTLGDWSVTSATITLSDGNHVVTIIAIDNATNMATDSVSVLIDAFPPILVISSPVNGSIYATNDVTLYWNATDEEGFVASVFANIDAEAAVNVTGLNSWAFTGIADGKHMFTVTATDNAGNVAVKTTNFTVDATAPVIQITSPSANAFISANAVTVTWTVDASVSGLNGTDVRLVNATFDSYWIWVGNATSYEFTGLHDSVYTVYVMSGDMAGNSANVSRSFTIDTIAPVVTISSPTMGQMFNTTTVTIFWNATDANAPLKYYYKEGSGTSWNFTMNNHVQLALSNGSHIVTVRAMDPADNIGSASVTFVADADKPTVVISTPASGMLTNISTVKVFWNATDPTTAINRTEYSIDGGAFVKFNGTGPFNATFVGLADGLHTVVIVAYDAVENHNSSTVTFTVDTTAPTISAKSPTGTDKNLNVDITVTFSEQMNKASVSIVGVTVGSPVWATNNMTVTWHASGEAYSTNYTLTVSGKDLAGNLLGGTKTIVFSTKVQVIGFIKDANGNPVANATLELTMPSMPDMPAVWANTSADGSFAIVLPMGGDYQVKITKSGFDTTTKSATFGPGLAGNNLGTVAINQTADYTIPIVVVVIVVLAAILGYLFFVRGKKPKK